MINLITVVVTYNRKELLLKNLEAQAEQTFPVSTCIIVDNHSTDNTYEYLEQSGIFERLRIKYCYLDSNVGGAGGFEYGVKKIKEFECDVACLMDDDGRPFDKETFKNAIKVIEEYNLISSPFFINSLVLQNDELLTFQIRGGIVSKHQVMDVAENGIYRDAAAPFNGTFINKQLIDMIGYPRGEFFLRFDEVDYMDRALKAKAYVATIVSSLYYHPLTSTQEKIRFLGHYFTNDYETPWKEYYKFRNETVLEIEKGKNRFYVYEKYIKRIFGLYLFRIDSRKNVKKFLKLALNDSLNGKLGKTISPGQSHI